jgi:2-polyprenyl-3-methyl-5-hydroxy-6-metoxy-1,4-benzoquinol methylase
MVFVSEIRDAHALIIDGPVGGSWTNASRWESQMEDSWEYSIIQRKETEWPALSWNAQEALGRLDHFGAKSILEDRPGRLLDYGCGGGFFLREAKRAGWDVYGVEPLPVHAAYVRTHTDATVVNDTLRESNFPERHFNVVTSFQVFEHLPDPRESLRVLHGLMAPSSLLMIEVPNIDTWSVRLLGKRHRHFVQDHLNFFSARTLELLLSHNGFLPLYRYYPARQMTLKHLLQTWGPRFMPSGFSRLFQGIARRSSLDRRTLNVSVGDILTVIAQRA